MRKAISTLAALMVLCMLTIYAFAAGNTLAANADKTALGRGDTVVVTVEFNCQEAVSTVSALLEYDSEVFTVVEGKCNDQAGAVFTSYNEEHAGLALLFTDAQPREGLLGTFTLQVREAAKPGETAITLKPVFKAGAETLAADPIQLGFTVGCVHSWSEWSKAEGNTFQRTCSVCKETEQVTHGDADHVWGSNGLCTACGAQKPVDSTEPKPTLATVETTERMETIVTGPGIPGESIGGAIAETTQSAQENTEIPENNGVQPDWVILVIAPIAVLCVGAVWFAMKRK